MRIRQNAIELFFFSARLIIVQCVQACLVAEQQARIKPYRIIEAIQTTLATQPAQANHAHIQEGYALFIHAALHCVMQNSLRSFQCIQQARQLGNRYFTAYLLPIPGKIQAIDERPCIHKARMIYFSPLPVKNPKEYLLILSCLSSLPAQFTATNCLNGYNSRLKQWHRMWMKRRFRMNRLAQHPCASRGKKPVPWPI